MTQSYYFLVTAANLFYIIFSAFERECRSEFRLSVFGSGERLKTPVIVILTSGVGLSYVEAKLNQVVTIYFLVAMCGCSY